MRRVLVVTHSISPPGGGEGLAAWVLQALRGDHDLSLQTWSPVDLEATNRFFGTNLRTGDARIFTVDPVWRRIVAGSHLRMATLRDALLMRAARQRATTYDIVLGTMNEADLGERAVQYVHYPRFDPDRQVAPKWYQIPFLVRLYRDLVLRATGYSAERMRAAVTLANSDWTARRVHRLHGIRARTVYPPTWSQTVPATPWEERENSFVCVGRISPEKRIKHIMDIIEGVRRRGHAVRLHIVGHVGDPAYLETIYKRIRPHSDWVALHRDLSRRELAQLIGAQRFGLHAMRDEHFGMAVAEMAAAGCIVFTPNSGGQVEIAGSDDRLLYSSMEDAILKITAVLASPGLQTSLREQAAQLAPRFSAQRFMAEIRDVVASL